MWNESMSFRGFLCLFLVVYGIWLADTQSPGELPAMTHKKPHYNVDGKSDPYFLPDAIRAPNDFQVQYGTEASDLLYYFDYRNLREFPKGTMDLRPLVSDFNYAGSCSVPFARGTLRIREYGFSSRDTIGYYSDKNHRDGVLNPSNEGVLKQFSIPSIRTCCTTPDCEDQNFLVDQKDTVFIIYDRKGRRALIRGRCRLCLLKDSTRECRNGEFASGLALFDQATGYQLRYIKCEPCDKGTWNTCLQGRTCRWQIPDTFRNPANGNYTPYLRPPPVEKCFACDQAKLWQQHYLDTELSYTLPQNTKEWYCAGGKDPPRACPSPALAHSDDWSTCVCPDSTYPNPSNPNQCISCEKGHYCTKGKIIKCSDHYFQAKTGQTACELCASTDDITGIYNFCEQNKQLQICNTSVPGTQNRALSSNCVECSKCKRLYSSEAAGQLHCYRSYRAGIV